VSPTQTPSSPPALRRSSLGRGQLAISARWEWLLFALILLTAAFMRLYRLDGIPPGLTHDEADTGYFITAVYNGSRSPVETPYGYANEPFSMYSGALFMAILGPTDLALRLHSAFFGLLTLLFGYLWTRRAFGVPTALGMAALTALSFWPIATSRFALNPQPAPALFAAAVWFLWLALFDAHPPRHRWWAWLLSTVFMAGALWAYEVARSTSAALVVFGFYLAMTDRERMRQRGRWFAGTLFLGFALAAPHLLDPAAWQRSSTLATTLRALRAGDLGPLFTTIGEALGTLFYRGDPFLTYNVPGRPIFELLVGLLFCAGLLLCLKWWRRPACAFTLLWVATGLLPSMIVGAWNSTLHSMGLQPIIFVPPALFAVEAARWLGRRYGGRAARAVAVAFVALVAFTGLRTFSDYFLEWGEWPAVRAAYFHNLAAITDYLNATPHSGVVTLSSPFPDLPHDPFITDLRVQRDDLALRWFDGRRALLLPPVERSLLILPASAPLGSPLAAWVPLSSAARIHLRPDDTAPYFDVLLWHPQRVWQEIVTRLPGRTVHGERPLTLPVNLRAVELVGYDLKTPVVAPGGTVSLLTAWRVLDPAALGPLPPQRYGQSASLFAHLLDAAGQVVGQEDRLDVPAWNWQPGDHFLQVHQFTLPPALPAGSYALEVGLYTLPDLVRLPVMTAAGAAGDRILLQSVEVSVP
jgi:4-amino-4-deoxy-L-arabinose transferase-like glycosyltransferase